MQDHQNQRYGRGMAGWLAAAGVGLGIAALSLLQPAAGEAASASQRLPAPAQDVPAGNGTQTAILAGGCFWGVEGAFQHVKGVRSVVSGYAGGTAASADYDTVSSGTTRHAEAVEIVYDPREVSYGTLLAIFFSAVHDPTQQGGQGPDMGTQYRSAIFPRNEVQARVAAAYIRQLDAGDALGRPVATTVEPGAHFYKAEAYHQDYMEHHPMQPYIVMYDKPKLGALKSLFPDYYREKPALSVADGG